MNKKADNVLRTITVERHNKTIMRLLSQHGEEIQKLKEKIRELETKKTRKDKITKKLPVAAAYTNA